jgi:hypothetical protein
MKCMLAALPDQILGGMSTVLKKEGVAAGNITKELMEEMIGSLLREAVGERTPPEAPTLPSFDYEAYLWADGTFHLLPEDYRFPSVSVKKCWILWWKGNPEKNTIP